MPPPTAGVGLGIMGERHVVSFIGLPARGKQFMAERLRLYLDFFHCAHCEVFDIAEPHLDSDEKVFSALQTFLEQEDEQASRQLLKATSGLEDEALERLKKNVDSGQIALLDTHDAFNTHERIWSGSSKERRYYCCFVLAKCQTHIQSCSASSCTKQKAGGGPQFENVFLQVARDIGKQKGMKVNVPSHIPIKFGFACTG